MKTIWADLNARTVDDLVSLETRGSKASLALVPVCVGDQVQLTDGELVVPASIELHGNRWFGRPDWNAVAALPPGRAAELATLDFPELAEVPTRWIEVLAAGGAKKTAGDR